MQTQKTNHSFRNNLARIFLSSVLISSILGGDFKKPLTNLETRVAQTAKASDENSWIKSPVQLMHEQRGFELYSNWEEESSLELIEILKSKGISAFRDTAYMNDGKTILPGLCSIYTNVSKDKIKDVVYPWFFELERMNFKPKEKFSGSFDDVVEIVQQEFGITSAKDSKPVLATYGTGPCLAVVGYNPEDKIGFLAHLDSASSEISPALVYNLEKISKNKKQKYEFYIIGGQSKDQKKQVEEIIDSLTIRNLNEAVKFELTEKDLYGGNEISSRSMALDTRTGIVYDYEPMEGIKYDSIKKQREKPVLLSHFKSSPHLIYLPSGAR